MPTVLKTTLRLAVDVVATIVFLILAIKPVAYMAGLAVACSVAAFSVLPVLADYARLANGSFEYTARLISWFAIYVVLIFAIVMEVIRRLVGHERLSVYLIIAALGVPVALVLAGYVGPLHHDGIGLGTHEEGAAGTMSDVVAIAMVIVAGAAGGTLYWLITVKLRAALTFLLKRLLCGAKPRAPLCALF
jgi:hypothetical protein